MRVAAGGDHDIVSACAALVDERLRVRQQPVVRVHAEFRCGGLGAARRHDAERRIGIDHRGTRAKRTRDAVERERPAVHIRSDNDAQRGQRGAQRRELRLAVGARDDARNRARDREELRELRRAVRNVQRQRDGARLGEREVRQREGGAIWQVQPDDVAVADAGAFELGRQRVDARRDLAPRQPQRPVDVRRRTRRARGGGGQHAAAREAEQGARVARVVADQILGAVHGGRQVGSTGRGRRGWQDSAKMVDVSNHWRGQ